MKLSKIRVDAFFKPLLVAMGMLHFCNVNAQQITGTVSAEGNNLPGATIKIAQQKTTIISDINGAFYVQNKTLGKLSLVINYVGFAEKTVEVYVKAGENNLGIITL
ncbi:MAG: hypothetical protein RIR31_1119, partial [Bacteroidota bacterium]